LDFAVLDVLPEELETMKRMKVLYLIFQTATSRVFIDGEVMT
jgi:hypothetical protein